MATNSKKKRRKKTESIRNNRIYYRFYNLYGYCWKSWLLGFAL